MTHFNSDLLLRGELSYEDLLCGMPHIGVIVADLRKSLRGEKQTWSINLENIRDLELANEVETCLAKFKELTSTAQTVQHE